MLGSIRKIWNPSQAAANPVDLSSVAANPGDWVRQQFSTIVADHQTMVYSLALRSLRNTARAEELTQEVFLSLFENHQSIASPDHLRHWLRRVVARRCIDESRRQKHRNTYTLDEVREPASQDQPDKQLFHRQIYALVDRLPPQARIIVLLRYQDDLDPAEIASILGVPLGTVKSRLARSLQALRLLVVKGVPSENLLPTNALSARSQT